MLTDANNNAFNTKPVLSILCEIPAVDVTHTACKKRHYTKMKLVSFRLNLNVRCSDFNIKIAAVQH